MSEESKEETHMESHEEKKEEKDNTDMKGVEVEQMEGGKGEQERTGEGRDTEADGAAEGSEEEEEARPAKDTQRGVSEEGEIEDPPLPDEEPPLPEGPPPDEPNDGWEAIWEPTANAYYFYNAFTGVTTWENPRVPQDATQSQDPAAASVAAAYPGASAEGFPAGYPPAPGTGDAYAGDMGPPGTDSEGNLTFYQLQHGITEPGKVTAEDIAESYSSGARFNRFTGKFQMNKGPEDYSDEAKSKRQMNFYFDVDAAANSHEGKSLKAERQRQKLSKKEVKAFKEKRREKKEQKRRAWLKD